MTLIPVIDISPLFGDNIEEKLNVGKQIDNVCKFTGFFQITNHGIPDLQKFTEKAFEFFNNLTTDQKMKMAPKKFNPKNKHVYRGYFPASVNGNHILKKINKLSLLKLFPKNIQAKKDLTWEIQQLKLTVIC